MTIYFIRAVDCGRIKIGFTDSPTPTSRLNSMQTGCPSDLEVLAYCAGSEEREGALHAELALSRVRGEWFRPTKKLASLVVYAMKTKTTDGWEEAEQNPEEFARFFAKHKAVKRLEWADLDDTDIAWRIALEREERVSPADRVARWPDDLLFEHDEPCRYKQCVEHRLQETDYIATQFGWRSAHRGFIACNKAEQLTVELLADAKDEAMECAIWAGACIHFLTNDRRGNCFTARDRVPGIDSLEARIRDLLPETWNSRSTCPLPLAFELPHRCLLTPSEFLLMVARHRQATLSRFIPCVAWQHGAFYEVPHRKQEAA